VITVITDQRLDTIFSRRSHINMGRLRQTLKRVFSRKHKHPKVAKAMSPPTTASTISLPPGPPQTSSSLPAPPQTSSSLPAPPRRTDSFSFEQSPLPPRTSPSPEARPTNQCYGCEREIDNGFGSALVPCGHTRMHYRCARLLSRYGQQWFSCPTCRVTLDVAMAATTEEWGYRASHEGRESRTSWRN
jgi:hypothetical protein